MYQKFLSLYTTVFFVLKYEGTIPNIIASFFKYEYFTLFPREKQAFGITVGNHITDLNWHG